MKSLLAVFLLVSTACADEDTSAEWEALKAVSHSNLDFTNSLYQVLSRNEGNLIFSPASIHTILALTSQGARGTTAQQMIDGLHLPADQETTRSGFRKLTTSLQSQSDVALKVANRIFTDNHFPPTAEFKQTASNDFHSDSQTVDFLRNPDEARRAVNTWVEGQTEHKIRDLLEEGTVHVNTKMVLANAIYFKGTWKTKFETAKTTSKPFHVSPGLTEEVPMMHIEGRSGYGYKRSKVLNADILEMPYVGNKVSLVIILPKKRFGLSDVEARLANLTISNITSHVITRGAAVKLALPKFKMEVATELTEVLQQMGMADMFGDNADFSGLTMAPTRVSQVAHKVIIEVNEEGTEAAAATGVVGNFRSGMRLTTFNADHPFIFLLVNTERHTHFRERTVLFMGRYANP